MATFAALRVKIAKMSERVQREAPGIIAETAVEYYKQRFTAKAFDGKPWAAAKRPNNRGSLMVRSGSLMNTVRPSLVTAKEVRISAGGPKVRYAKIHNEGGTIKQIPTPKQRRFLWAMAHAGGEMKGADGPGMYGRSAMARELTIPIPKRQFIGRSAELNRTIVARLQALAKL